MVRRFVLLICVLGCQETVHDEPDVQVSAPQAAAKAAEVVAEHAGEATSDNTQEPEVAKVADESVEDPIPSKAEIEALVDEFEHTPFDGRARFVLDEQLYRDEFVTCYMDADETQIAGYLKSSVLSVKRAGKPQHFIAAVRRRFEEGFARTPVKTMYFVETKNGLKLDWGATTGFNPVSFAGWRAGGGDSITLRVNAQLGDFVTPAYSNARFSLVIIGCEEEFGDIEGYFTGYAGKGTDIGIQVFELLKDGQKHQLTLKLKNSNWDNAIAASIDAVVSDSWCF